MLPPYRRSTRPNFLAMLCIGIVACGSTAVDPNSPVTILDSAGNNQWAGPGSPLPGQIQVLIGRGGKAEAGAVVHFTTTSGTFAPAVVTTGADGIAKTTWIMPAGADPRSVGGTIAVDNGPTVSVTAFVVPATNVVVSVVNNAFSPVSPTIQRGQTVTWLWYDGAVGHSVTPVGLEPVGSGGVKDGPFVYSYSFPTSGNYTFYCTNHGGPTGTGMAGVIVVQP
jgi:plastocyanin